MTPLDRLRALCMALPEVTEKISHGEPAWFVRRSFVTFADHHHDNRLAFWCAAPPGAQEELVAAAPDRYFRPPYVGGRGWLGVWLDAPDADAPGRAGTASTGGSGTGTDRAPAADAFWEEVAEIVTDAYRTVAPRTLVALLDASTTPR